MDPAASTLFGKTRQAVLTALFEAGDSGIYLRQMERESGISTGALHQELGQLIKADLVRKHQDGNRVLYKINQTHPVTAPLREIVEKTCGIPAQLRQALQPLENQIRFAAIFGSIAKGTNHSASDIDLLLVADLTPTQVIEQIQQLESSLGREIGFRIYSPTEFHERSKTDEFLKKVLNQPLIPLLGTINDA
jgi:predicted nucleotidyltransferase